MTEYGQQFAVILGQIDQLVGKDDLAAGQGQGVGTDGIALAQHRPDPPLRVAVGVFVEQCQQLPLAFRREFAWAEGGLVEDFKAALAELAVDLRRQRFGHAAGQSRDAVFDGNEDEGDHQQGE